jgi:pyruvate,water dikinase
VSFPSRILLVTLLLGACACGDSGGSPSVDGGAPDADAAPGADTDPDMSDEVNPGPPAFLNALGTPADLAAMSDGKTVEVKYLAPVAGRPPFPPLGASCYFQNMRRYTWHLTFLQSFPERADLSYDAYLALVTRSSRRLWGGAVKLWPNAIHPRTGAAGVLAYTIYGEPGSVDAAAVGEVFRTLGGCMPFAGDLLVFVPTLDDQVALVQRERAALAADGIAALFPEELAGDITHLAHSAGQGYGTLRIVPRGQPLREYGPRDVVLVESAPNDISIVAGVITRNPQNDLGHVNLRLREKGVPNVTVPGIYDAAWVRALDGYLVRLVVSAQSFALEPATLADAQAFWDAHRPTVRAPTADLTVSELRSFRSLRATDAIAYGPKAANLGELTRVLDLPNRNDGFGIPLSRYRDFIAGSGLGPDIETMLADPRMRSDAAFKRSRLKDLRQRIRVGDFSPALFQALQATIPEVFGAAGGQQRLRFRSSTNVEDLDSFTGAGLYESRTGCLADDLDADASGPSACLTAAERTSLEQERSAREAELQAHPDRVWLGPIIADLTEDLTEEKPVSEAIRKVWASLWEERAFDEREYYGIDHRLAYMGVAVNPSFVLERASAVAITNLQVDGGAALYRLNSQAGRESVVQPEDPTAVAELLSFRRVGDPPQAGELSIQVRSNRVPDGEQVWPADRLAELARLLFRIQDHFANQVYPHIVPLHLDLEIKHSAEGQVVIKQVRPFSDQRQP